MKRTTAVIEVTWLETLGSGRQGVKPFVLWPWSGPGKGFWERKATGQLREGWTAPGSWCHSGLWPAVSHWPGRAPPGPSQARSDSCGRGRGPCRLGDPQSWPVTLRWKLCPPAPQPPDSPSVSWPGSAISDRSLRCKWGNNSEINSGRCARHSIFQKPWSCRLPQGIWWRRLVGGIIKEMVRWEGLCLGTPGAQVRILSLDKPPYWVACLVCLLWSGTGSI